VTGDTFVDTVMHHTAEMCGVLCAYAVIARYDEIRRRLGKPENPEELYGVSVLASAVGRAVITSLMPREKGG